MNGREPTHKHLLIGFHESTLKNTKHANASAKLPEDKAIPSQKEKNKKKLQPKLEHDIHKDKKKPKRKGLVGI
jgi:hypothetical protein